MEILHFEICPHVLHFKRPAGTSRGVYTTRKSWFLHLTDPADPEKEAWGECAPLPNLSCDDIEDYERVLADFCQDVSQKGYIDYPLWRNYPSMVFGMETALQHWKTGSLAFWETPFSRGEQGIQINGLIWMGDYDYMYEQILKKMELGFRCIKLKIGAIDFEQELDLLRFIRSRFPVGTIELRVDANGAFKPEDALDKLNRLAEIGLHSIEQPIRAGQRSEMARLTAESRLPIAFDEELIGINDRVEKARLLDETKPAYIVLKPSLHGGMKGSKEWIEEAEKRNIGWWITSALESNVGLNAIGQWCATLNTTLPQGLGTGQLFVDNVDIPLEVRQDALWFSAPEQAKKKIVLE